MADLQSAHRSALRLILSLQTGLQKLEAQEGRTHNPPSEEALKELEAKHAQLEKASSSLDSQWRMASLRDQAGNARSQELWARKSAQVAEECQVLGDGIARARMRAARAGAEAAHREELLGFRARGGHVARVDPNDEAAALGSISRSRRVLEEAYETGVATLQAISGQRDVLKSAHRKALDVMTSLGISDSILKTAEKRLKMDQVVAYGGMGLIVLVVLLLWWFLKR